MKIHISLETKILLDSIGGYILEPRGLIMVDVSFNPKLIDALSWNEYVCFILKLEV